MNISLTSWCGAILYLILSSLPSMAEKRVALVIGNSHYLNAGRLANPKNDAKDIARNLRDLKFDVTMALDLDLKGFSTTFKVFSNKLQDAEVALLFYAGHGMQFKGKNVLIPVDAELKNEFSIRRETIPLNDFIEIMEDKAKVNLVFLDACRNNPLTTRINRSLSRTRSLPLVQGLGRIERKASETLIVYATAPNAVAADGEGRNSPFTNALLQHLRTPDLEVEVMLKRVTRTVLDKTDDLQKPERLSQLSSEFYFNKQTLEKALAEHSELDLLQQIQTLEERLNGQRASPHTKRVERTRDRSRLKIIKPQTVLISGGQFSMGCATRPTCRSDEIPVHTVRVDSFHMAKYETTFAQWEACVADGFCPSIDDDEGWGRGQRPIINVSWFDAYKYTKWLSRKTGQKWRLPTEAEWEYASRAGASTSYAFGNHIRPDQANFGGHIAKSRRVGQYRANKFGLYDMHGNVSEWVADKYSKDYYRTSPRDNPKGPEKGDKRVSRGGDWYYDVRTIRSAMRFAAPPARRLSNVGFRVVKED